MLDSKPAVMGVSSVVCVKLTSVGTLISAKGTYPAPISMKECSRM